MIHVTSVVVKSALSTRGFRVMATSTVAKWYCASDSECSNTSNSQCNQNRVEAGLVLQKK